MSKIAFILAIIAIIAPITWDHLKAQTGIEVHLLQTAKLVEPSEKLDKLEIRYDGKVVTKVTRVTFSVVNSGRIPITKADFITPLIVRFPDSAELLDIRVNKRIPSDTEVKITESFNEGSFNLAFELLNPGDQIIFTALLGGEYTKMNASARVVNMPQLVVIDRSRDEERRSKVTTLIYVIGGISFLFLLSSISIFLSEIGENPKTKRDLLLSNNRFSSLKTKDEYLEFVLNDELSKPLSLNARQDLRAEIFAVNETEFDAPTRARFNRLIASEIASPGLKETLLPLCVAAISIFGLWYACSNIYEAYYVIKLSNLQP